MSVSVAAGSAAPSHGCKPMLDKAIPPRMLKLNAADNVAVAVDPVDLGVTAQGVTALKLIPRGHKRSTRILYPSV